MVDLCKCGVRTTEFSFTLPLPLFKLISHFLSKMSAVQFNLILLCKAEEASAVNDYFRTMCYSITIVGIRSVSLPSITVKLM